MIRYNTKDRIDSGDRMICWSTQDGDRREIPFSVLLEFMRDNLGSPDFDTIFVQPVSNLFVAAFLDTSQNQWMLLQPMGSFTNGTITLPAFANCIDGQELIVNCTQQVTNLTVAANGALDVIGAPTALAAGDTFRVKFSRITSCWYVI
jgi:hypothetical protein